MAVFLVDRARGNTLDLANVLSTVALINVLRTAIGTRQSLVHINTSHGLRQPALLLRASLMPSY